jgi:tetratricopeptide (TPR) repeat protein
MKGIVLNKINRHQEASICFDKALSINPHNATALTMTKSNHILKSSDAGGIAFNKAGYLLKAKKYEEAIPYYEEAIKQFSLTPDSQDLIASLNSILSSCYYGIKKYKKALTCVDIALSICPINVDYLGKKSTLLSKLEKPEEALVTITKALKIDPDNPNLWNSKGCYLFDSSKYEEAIICYDKSLEKDPDKSMYLSNKGECLDKLSKYPESISYYERALEKDPNNEKIQKDLDSVKAKLSKDSSSKTVEKVEVIKKSEPLDVLKMRLAKGEITPEEFNKIKDIL